MSSASSSLSFLIDIEHPKNHSPRKTMGPCFVFLCFLRVISVWHSYSHMTLNLNVWQPNRHSINTATSRAQAGPGANRAIHGTNVELIFNLIGTLIWPTYHMNK